VSEYNNIVCHFCVNLFVEDDTPNMKDLNRYVVRKYAAEWKDIGTELDIDIDMLNIIEKDNPWQSEICFQKTLEKWLKGSTNATWRTLEVALTNVRRQKVDHGSIDYVYGKCVTWKSSLAVKQQGQVIDYRVHPKI